MNRIFAVLLLQVMSIGPYTAEVPKDDPRAPVIESKMTDAEQAALSLAEQDVADKQALLDLAQQRLENEKYRIIQRHRTKETGDFARCGELTYLPAIERAWVVFRLGYQQCRGV